MNTRMSTSIPSLESLEQRLLLAVNPVVTVGSPTSSTVPLSWAPVSGATAVRVYVAPEPSAVPGAALPSEVLVASLSGGTTSYSVTGLAPGVDTFFRVEVDQGASGTGATNAHAKTIGGPRPVVGYNELDTPIREVHAYGPNILELVVEDSGSSGQPATKGAAFQNGTWTITRANGATITVTQKYRFSAPVGEHYTTGQPSGGTDIFDIDHQIFLVLDQNIGSRDVLTISLSNAGTLNTTFTLPFSDQYLETPVIKVNQVGYNPSATERYAYVSGWMGDGAGLSLANFPSTADVLIEPTNPMALRTVALDNTAITVRSSNDTEAGSAVNQINLSSLPAAEGTRYRVQIPGVGVSWATAVSQEAAFKAYYVVTRGMFLNRWAGDLQLQYTEFARPQDHVVTPANSVLQGSTPSGLPEGSPAVYTGDAINWDAGGDWYPNAPRPITAPRTIIGGYHDAGDFDQRPMHTQVAQVLLRAYELDPGKYLDGQLTIPESGNGIPDLLDEALWGVRGWESLQEASGGVDSGVGTTGHPGGFYYADQDRKIWWTYAPDPQTTARCAGLFAQAAYLVAPYDSARAAQLQSKAIAAYNWAMDSSHKDLNGGGAAATYLMYGAGELYRLTGQTQYKTDFETHWYNSNMYHNPFSGSMLDSLSDFGQYKWYHGALPDFVQGYLHGANPDAGIVQICRNAFTQDATSSQTLLNNTGSTDFTAFRQTRPGTASMDWGNSVTPNRWLDQTLSLIQMGGVSAPTLQSYFNELSFDADYVLGCNPQGMTYITGLGTASPPFVLMTDMLAFQKDGKGVMPGIPTYGPVGSFQQGGGYTAPLTTFYPAVTYGTNLPEGFRYGLSTGFVQCSEFDINVQALLTQMFSVLVGDGYETPDSYLPGGFDADNPLPSFGTATNRAPVVEAGTQRTLSSLAPYSLVLNGQAVDDHFSGALTTTWSKESGPGTVTFGNANALNSTATFEKPGTYVLRLTASDGSLSASECQTIIVKDPSKGIFQNGDFEQGMDGSWPVGYGNGDNSSAVSLVSASSVGRSGQYVLHLTPGDYSTVITNKPQQNTLVQTKNTNYVLHFWYKFANTTTLSTTIGMAYGGGTSFATTSITGTDTAWHEKTLNFSSGSYSDFYIYLYTSSGGGPARNFYIDDMFVTVANQSNTAPSVNAGNDQTITMPSSASLSGAVSDDGLPSGALTYTWSKVSGQGMVTFGNANAKDTTATFSSYGNYVLRLTASDGSLPNSDDVAITVRDLPVANADSYSIAQNGTLIQGTTGGLLSNDTDDAGHTLTASKVTDPGHGTVTISTNGSFTYVPTAGYSGPDSFTYRVYDGTTYSSSATVSINVMQTSSSIFTNPGFETGNLSGWSGDTAHLAVVQGISGASGTYCVHSTSGDYTYPTIGNQPQAGGQSNTDYTFSFKYKWAATGKQFKAVVVNQSAQVLAYYYSTGTDTNWHTASLNFNSGSSTSFYVAFNNEGGGGGTRDYYLDDVAVTVNAANTAPVAVSDSYAVNENSSITVWAPGILANDSDAEGDILTASKASDPAHGTLTLTGDGQFTYVPAANWYGTDSFTYTVNDGKVNSNVATVTLTVRDVPIAVGDSYTVNENATLTVAAPGVLSNDSDPASHSLTASKLTDPAHGALTFNSNGSFTYVPTTNWFGTDTFTYKVNDGTTDSAPATVTITVRDVPTATNDSYTVNENGTLTVAAAGVLSNDSDPASHALTAVKLTNPAHGSVTLNGDGGFTYVPTTNWYGTDSFTYKVNDGTTDSATATVTITVRDVPTAGNDSYSVNTNSTLTVSTPGVKSNDSDPASHSLTASKLTDPAHGTLTFSSDGSFTYVPTTNWFGTDSFTYKVNDGTTDSAAATVTITVRDIPVATDDTYRPMENATFTQVATGGLLGNDIDPAGHTLTASKVANPSHGTVTVNSDGSFTYTPTANWYGTDSFTYKVNDGTLDSNTATVTLTVVQTDNSIFTNPGFETGNFTGWASHDANATIASGISGSTGTYCLHVTSGNYIYPVLSSSISGTEQTNTNYIFSYRIKFNQNFQTKGVQAYIYEYAWPNQYTLVSQWMTNPQDTDWHTYTLPFNSGSHTQFYIRFDHVGGGTGTYDYYLDDVAVAVNPNSAPVANGDSYAVNENGTLTVSTPGVLTNDTDAENNSLTATKVTDPAHGTVTFNSNGSFTYVPTANWYGTDSFTYKANDGSLNSAAATVNIIVRDVPTVTNDSFAVNENNTLIVSAPGVISNDSDPASHSLTASKLTDPSHGTVTLNSDGSFSYVPTANWYGTDSFTYKVNDGTTDSAAATVTITVRDVPTATNDSYTVNEDSSLIKAANAGVLINDTDPASHSLTALLVSGPSHGLLGLNTDGSFTYTPTAHWYGADSFTYKASDGTTDSTATVSIMVVQTDNSIFPNAGFETGDLTDWGGDTSHLAVVDGIDGSVGDYVLHVTSGDWIRAVSNQVVRQAANPIQKTDTNYTLSFNLKWVSTNNQKSVEVAVLGDGESLLGHQFVTYSTSVGTDWHTYTLNFNSGDSWNNGYEYFYIVFSHNGGAGSTLNYYLDEVCVVETPNRAPVASNDAYSVNENGTLTVAASGVLNNDSDADEDAITATKLTNPAHGTVTFNSDGSFTYVPTANWYGTDSFTYKVNDGSLDSNTATVTIAVADVPTATNDSYSTNEDTQLVVSGAGILGNDVDQASHALVAALMTSPQHGTLSYTESGTFTYTPNANWNGVDSFIYKAFDGTTYSNEGTVSITVSAVNDAPVAVADSYSTNEDTPLVVSNPGVLGNDTDADGNPLTAIKVSDPAHGSVTLNSNGSFTYTPSANWNGTDSFTYKANDGTADSNVATVTITVNAVNDAPVAVADSDYFTNRNGQLVVAAPGLLGNDTDVENSTLTAAKVTDPSHGTLTLNSDGSFTYTPTSNWSGVDSFTYKANDGTADSNTATVTIRVSMFSNPGFETGNLTGWSGDTANLALATGVSGATGTYCLHATSGSYVFPVIGNSSQKTSAGQQTNTQYTFTFRYKWVSTTKQFTADILSNGDAVISGHTFSYQDTDWHTYSVTFNSGSYTGFYVSFNNEGGGGGNRDYYLDDILVYPS